jgi:hypothetical protein
MKRFNPAAVSISPPEPATSAVADRKLLVGQRVHCILYGGMDGIIYEIAGEQRPETISKLGGGVGVMGGNADFRIVFTGERAHLSTVPESIVLGSCQWSIADGIAEADEIKTALAAAEAKKKADESEQLRKTNERAEKRAALPKLYPWLETIAQQKHNGARTKSSHALGAANLKTELMREFCGVKFSVKSESYAGGDAIRVRWDFGPTNDEVAKFTDKYREGDFDGMTDSYDYNHDNVWPDVFGGSKYVTESRCYGGQSVPDFYEQVGRALCALQHIEYAGQFTRHLLGSNCDRDLSQYVNELLSRTHIPVGAKFKGVEYTPDAERAANHWCRIVFDLPPPAKPASPVSSVATTQLLETQHTKTKIPLFVVQLGQRVDRPTYEMLNQHAKTLGGYYSSYRRDGAVPGFIFKTREPAEKFIEAVQITLGVQPVATTQPEPTPANVPPPQPSPANLPPVAVRKDWRKHFLRN